MPPRRDEEDFAAQRPISCHGTDFRPPVRAQERSAGERGWKKGNPDGKKGIRVENPKGGQEPGTADENAYPSQGRRGQRPRMRKEESA